MQIDESDAIRERYDRRDSDEESLYGALLPSVYMGLQERQRNLIELLKQGRFTNVGELSVLEVGCGSGPNLAELIALGFTAARLSGVDLLEHLVKEARLKLPSEVNLNVDDAATMKIAPSSFDLVYQSTVFSSILDDVYQAQLARKMWTWVRPAGALIWYDFDVDNPSNQDVRGVPPDKIRQLFPDGQMLRRRVTLAPPIARRVTKISPKLYTLVNSLSVLRTHSLCLIMKPK